MKDLESFYDQNVERVYKFFYINCLNKQTAEDLTSQTFIAFIEKKEGQNINKPKQYLYGIMRNVWTEYLKQKYRQKIVDLENINDFERYIDQNINSFESSSIQNRALKYIQQLPRAQKEVMTLRFVKGMSVEDSSSELGKSKLYIKTTQHRAVKRLRVLMSEPQMEGLSQ